MCLQSILQPPKEVEESLQPDHKPGAAKTGAMRFQALKRPSHHARVRRIY